MLKKKMPGSLLFYGLALAASLCQAENLGSFKSPDIEHRPKFRYWLPDASVPNEAVAEDLAAVAGVGAGGVEFLPYYNYGLPEADRGVDPPTDWTIYGFGTEAYRETFLTALRASQENGLVMDFAQGANQGQGTPAEPGSAGLAFELTYSNVTIQSGETFSGVLPLSRQPDNLLGSFMHKLEDFGDQTLLAAQAVRVTNTSQISVDGDGNIVTFAVQDLDEPVDLTSSVDKDRSLTWTAPDGNSTWRIFAWYERQANQHSCSPGLNATNYVQNGSWTVDHFSATGAKKITDFLDEHLFQDKESRELLAAVGKYAWEDSMEMQTALLWTPGFREKFKESRGYDIAPCLPYLIVRDNYWGQAIVPYGEVFTATNSTLQEQCNQDYRQVLNEGYKEYLGHFVEWAHSLGIEYSAQPAYNFPLDMLDDIPLLDGPEGESLGFSNIVDTYRQFAGPAHLAGIPVVSSECGAARGAPYLQTQNDLLWSVRRGLAGGISMNVLHGFAYSGPYANTTWPSYTTFTYRFTEMWNHHQPVWRHFNDTIHYISRNQFISLTGTPKVDLAFYFYSAPWVVEGEYQETNLQDLGYTYDYLAPGNLLTDHAVVDGATLAPTGPAYKALVFSNQTAISPVAAARIQELATAGLPIFFVGATNFTSIGKKAGEAEEVAAIMSGVVDGGLDNVHAVSSATELPDALKAAGILPKVSLPEPIPDFYNFWRSSDSIEYAFLYNDGKVSQTADILFNVSGTPYLFDAWTGNVSPVLQYTSSSDGVTIPITLLSNQTAVIGFAATSDATSELPLAPKAHIAKSSGSISGLKYSANSVTAQLGGSASFTLSDGSTKNLTASPPAASNLTTWDLTIEDWHRTNDTFSMETAIDYHTYKSQPLTPWLELDPSLASVSGIGTYNTNFSYPATARGAPSLGAILHLGPITNSVRAWLNGQVLPPIDIANPNVDVTDYVQTGNNDLVVEITTTLFNRIKADGNSTWSVGVTANDESLNYYGINAAYEYGLVGPVSVEWVVEEKIV
ncbi:hypothetical protein JOL62DRAFT_360383 [Phyllosticta paracitricarpa]|uniref:Secreted protein n=1 Tax=Phyllosticta paracitricarpa TaxID=2016321 RepID=A0ABR1MX33_9PEZI